MAPTPSLRVDKSFTYRGAPHVFSNRYHFNGGTPADIAHWHALMDQVMVQEKLIYMPNVSIVGMVGYEAGSELPVASKTYTQAGTGAFGGFVETPGDCAALVRYDTTARSAKNHPIYLFNYYHGAGTTISNGPDLLNAGQRDALDAYAALWLSGFSDGTNTVVRAGPNGATATAHVTKGNVTHRDFPA